MEITKSTVEQYKVRFDDNSYWADITIDTDGGKQGRIMIASDFGSWQNYWGAAGPTFKEFLTSINIDYAADKMGADGWFDKEASIANYRQAVKDNLKCHYIDKQEASDINAEIKELEEYDTNSKDVFITLVWSKRHLCNLLDNPDVITDIKPQFKRFWKVIWLPFIEELKKEFTIPAQPTTP